MVLFQPRYESTNVVGYFIWWTVCPKTYKYIGSAWHSGRFELFALAIMSRSWPCYWQHLPLSSIGAFVSGVMPWLSTLFISTRQWHTLELACLGVHVSLEGSIADWVEDGFGFSFGVSCLVEIAVAWWCAAHMSSAARQHLRVLFQFPSSRIGTWPILCCYVVRLGKLSTRAKFATLAQPIRLGKLS